MNLFDLLIWAASLLPAVWERPVAHPQYDRIQVGMTVQQVEAVMGRADISEHFATGASSPECLGTRMWLLEEGSACVNVGADDTVSCKWFVPYSRPTLKERARSWATTLLDR